MLCRAAGAEDIVVPNVNIVSDGNGQQIRRHLLRFVVIPFRKVRIVLPVDHSYIVCYQ